MIDVGRLCVKIAGRDAGKKCVVVEMLDNPFVLIDGETRRRKCNLKHLEALPETLGIKKGASHAEVVTAFKNLGIELKESKPKKAKPKQKQVRAAERKKLAPKVEKKAPAKELKKAAEKKGDKKTEEKEATKLEKVASEEGE